ncbi:glycoside hydrolase family 5 protein [Arcanobacterium phocae]|uniref:glycoside hydrolase family 5 protein n=1 Tax=Arcanobacterium phocae TaxID=131112 RepID=UPI001C0EDE0A|nr:cellulase family glycosylhydrolase [Arcanobacterium phocae]
MRLKWRKLAALVIGFAMGVSLLPEAAYASEKDDLSTGEQAKSIVETFGKGGDGGSYLTTSDGRQVILRGLNTHGSTKVAKDCMPEYYETDIARERGELSSNAVRLLMQWRCVEPEPGVYDDAYLDRVENLVNTYNSHGMTVLLDMHQDLYGPGVADIPGVGNGAPVWATYTDGLPVNKHDNWAMYYLEKGVIRAFDNFWNHTGKHPELMDHYAKMWAHVAHRFAHHPGVFGYDLMNEPFAGKSLPATLEKGPLADLYTRVINAIRETDNDTWIFLEPVALGANQGLGTHLPYIPDPRQGKPKIGYAPHMYMLGTEEGGMPQWSALAIKGAMRLWQANVRHQAKDLSSDGTTVPIVVGEYGLNTDKPGGLEYVKYAQWRLGMMGASTFYYSSDRGQWGPWDENGHNRNTHDLLATCYATVVGGFLDSQEPLADGCGIYFERGDGRNTEIQVPWASTIDDIRVEGATIVGFSPEEKILTINAGTFAQYKEVWVKRAK